MARPRWRPALGKTHVDRYTRFKEDSTLFRVVKEATCFLISATNGSPKSLPSAKTPNSFEAMSAKRLSIRKRAALRLSVDNAVLALPRRHTALWIQSLAEKGIDRGTRDPDFVKHDE